MVGEAADGAEAVQAVIDLQPHVVVMDLQMPVLDGYEATERIMAVRPTPIVVLSSRANRNQMQTAFEAMRRGALEVLPKPEDTPSWQQLAESLPETVRAVAEARAVRAGRAPPRPARAGRRPRASPPAAARRAELRWVAIGASTGGPAAIRELLDEVPADAPVGFLIVQHIASGFELGFADWLNKELPFDVRLAQDGEMLRRGAVRLAPGGAHLRLEAGGVLRLDAETPARRGHRPAVDEMFLSAAEHCPREVAGVLMTGMGSDGVEGLLALRQAGGITLAQDEASSVVFGMPRVALERGAADIALPPRELARALVADCGSERGAVNRRVLVVDDSEVTRAILARTLRGAGFEVLEARDGAEGAMTALRERPAVVVTDLEMPTMDGFPLLRLLKADPASAHMPVLILTSHGEAASRYWGLRTGADAYLTKDHRPRRAGRDRDRAWSRRPTPRPTRAAAAGALDPQAIGPVEVLARVARHLDASLLQATVVNTLLERGMAANDFHEAAHSALETLGQVVDAQLLAVAVAELDAGMIQILLQDPVRQTDVEVLADLLAKAVTHAPGTPFEVRIGGERGASPSSWSGRSGSPCRCATPPASSPSCRAIPTSSPPPRPAPWSRR